MRAFIIFLEDLFWNLRCCYGYWLHGGYGLAKIIEKMPYSFIVKYLRKYGATVGNNCRIERGINIHRPFGKNKPFEDLHIGDNVYIGHDVLIDLTRPVYFSDASNCGARTQFWTHASAYLGNTLDNLGYTEHTGEIYLDEGCTIFSNSVVKHGIKIGKFSNIGACSFANRNVDNHSSASGVPILAVKRKIS